MRFLFIFNTTQATLTVTVSYSLCYTFGLYSKHFVYYCTILGVSLLLCSSYTI